MAEYNLGGYLMGIPGREPEAVTHFQEVLRIKPEAYGVHSEICAYLLQTGHTAEAIAQFEAALRTARTRGVHFNPGLAFSKIPARAPDAISQFEAALQADPQFGRAHKELGMLLLRQGRTTEATPHLEAAQRLQYDPQIAGIMKALLAVKR